MNSTEEKMMDETMQDSQMTEETKMSKEELFMGLLKNKMIVLDEQYTEASRHQTDCYNDDKYSTAHFEAVEKCKIIKAKMSVISELQRCWEEMMTPVAV